MKKKAIIAIATLLAFGQGAWAVDKEDIGGIEWNKVKGYYEIDCANDLNDLATYVNDGGTTDGLTFMVTQDITFDAPVPPETSNFTPIGYGNESEGKCFKGIFNGNDKYIKGITVNTPSATGVALFGYIHQPAEIRNLTLKECSFTGNSEVGAIAGASSGSATDSEFGIYNCMVESPVNVTAVGTTVDNEYYPGTYAGGIIGYCGSLTVSGCTSAAVVVGDESVGGIAGHLTGSIHGGVIDDCIFTGSVQGGSEATEVGTIVGGRGPIEEAEGTDGKVKLTLYDADGDAIKNADRLRYYNGIENVDVTLSGRTLYKDGNWNTLCLPFDVSTATGPLSGVGVSAMTLNTSSSGLSGSTLTLNFSDVTSITAGTPFIIKWDSGSDLTSDLEFTNVTIKKAPNNTDVGEHVTFTGTYSPKVIGTGGDNTILYLGIGKDDENPDKDVSTLYYPNAAMTIYAFRAYFKLNGITAGAAAARAFVLNFGDDDATGIGATLMSSEKVNSEAWHSLDGRKLNSKPTQKGIYIYKGKKMVVK